MRSKNAKYHSQNPSDPRSTCRVMLPIKTSDWTNSARISKTFEIFLTERLRIRRAIVFPFEVKDWLFESSDPNITSQNWNELLKSQRCNKTVCSFFYLPRPAEDGLGTSEKDISADCLLNHDQKLPAVLNVDDCSYLKIIESVSRHMGPVLFIHGIDNVISTVF